MAEETHEPVKVDPKEDAKHAGEKKTHPGDAAKKPGGWIEQHKGLAYGGMALILIILYFFLRNNGSNSAASQTAAAQQAAADQTAAQQAAAGVPQSSGGGSGWSGGWGGASTSGASSTTGTTTSGTTAAGPGSTVATSGGSYGVGSNGLINSGTVDESWTDTGQKWSLSQLAGKLGVPVSSLAASNAAGTKASSNPNAPIAQGAKFTYKKGVS